MTLVGAVAAESPGVLCDVPADEQRGDGGAELVRQAAGLAHKFYGRIGELAVTAFAQYPNAW